MLTYPQIDPYIFQLGPIKPTWYGLAYVVGFFIAYMLGVYRARRSGVFSSAELGDLLTNMMFGVILGGRLGYVLFYGRSYWAEDFWYPLKIWQGGMSFHGGLLGVIVVLALFAYKKKMLFWTVTDFIAPLIPPGLFFGRLANFINGELWGKVTDVPWAMVFPHGGPLPRHPSQLYEALLEGLLMFVVLWLYSGSKRLPGKVTGLFLLLYACARMGVELVREPDAQIGALPLGLSMGQWLSVPMLLLGLYLFLRKKSYAGVSESA